MENKLLLRVHEVAELLGLSERAVWQRASKGEIPAPQRLGRSVRWHRPTLENFLNEEQAKLSRLAPKDMA